MQLVFEIVSYHRLSPEQISKKKVLDSITFGRSEKNDWHLPDPEKVVSGTHARIEKLADGFAIRDLSTNGLFINRAVEALGKDKTQILQDGDLLTFGDYEITVTIVNNRPQTVNTVSNTVLNKTAPPEAGIRGKSSHQGQATGISASDLFNESAETKQPMPSVNNDLNDHFSLPDIAIPEIARPQVATPINAIPAITKTSTSDMTMSEVSAPIVSIPEEWDFELLAKSTTRGKAVTETTNYQPTALKSPPSSLHTNADSQSATRSDGVKNTKNTAMSASGLDAFIQGLGISQGVLPEPFSDELCYEMGEAMQLLLSGLMESLRSRSSLKNEFRVNQTTFQQQENNPLKFSANIDDAFQNLFLRNSASFLSAKKAISEAFNDTKKHDIALTAGTLGAIEGVLNQLDPGVIENRDFKHSPLDKILPGQKQLRYWKIFQSLHKDMVEEQTVQGSSILSDDFVRAYDKKIKSL